MIEIAQSVDSKTWIGLVGVMLGATIGIIGVFLSNKSSLSRLQLQLMHEKELNQDKVKRERIEELYVILGHWVNDFFVIFFKLSLVMKGDISYNDYLDDITNEDKKHDIDFQRIEMIMNIYVPELKPAYEVVLSNREKINDISAAHKEEYKKGNIDGERFLKPSAAAHLVLEKSVDNLRLELAKVATNA